MALWSRFPLSPKFSHKPSGKNKRTFTSLRFACNFRPHKNYCINVVFSCYASSIQPEGSAMIFLCFIFQLAHGFLSVRFFFFFVLFFLFVCLSVVSLYFCLFVCLFVPSFVRSFVLVCSFFSFFFSFVRFFRSFFRLFDFSFVGFSLFVFSFVHL